MSADVRSTSQKVPISFGEKAYNLYFNLNAMALIEDRFGTIEEAMMQLTTGKIRPIRFLLWAGVTHEHVKAIDEATGEPTGYTVSEFDMGSLIDVTNIQTVTIALMDAINLGSPSEDVSQQLSDTDEDKADKNSRGDSASPTQPTGTDPNV